MTLAETISQAVLPPGLDPGDEALSFTGDGDTGDVFAVGELAAQSIGAAARALAAYAGRDRVSVDRRLASLWFARSLFPRDGALLRVRDELTGDYAAADGWIRLHGNVPAHRAVLDAILDQPRDRAAAVDTVRRWNALDLQEAVVDAGGAAAMMNSAAQWSAHPQGRALAQEPLVHWRAAGEVPLERALDRARPLAGLRVLDLTRILAGPAATRFLAAFGAEVLRIDPPGWEESGNIPEMTPGKRCATLDLRRAEDRRALAGLIRQADILVHGYRADALERLDLGDARRRDLNPGLIDVALDAYGWSGPWRARRGFDSLVQMSSGIAAHGMRAAGADQPRPLSVQALDHGTGYLVASATLNALRLRRDSGRVMSARLSLAATAETLKSAGNPPPATGFGPPIAAAGDQDLDPAIEETDWGPARRLKFPVRIDGIVARWNSPAVALHTARPEFG